MVRRFRRSLKELLTVPLPPQMQMMFRATILPTLKELPTDSLEEIRTFVNEELDKLIEERKVIDGAQPTD